MMKLQKRLFSLSLALTLGLLGAAPVLAQTPLNTAVQAEVARAQQKSRDVGVNIVQLDTGEAVFSYNPQLPRVIASNSKLFTTSTALDALGPAFQFETRFLMRGTVGDGVLHGDVGVVGAGDPQISGREYDGDPFAAFRPWAAALREKGVRRIAGDLYLAHGLFEALQIHPDWPRDQLAEWYEAPVAALSFSDNCILVRVSPGRAAGQPAIVETVPAVPIFRVDNTTSTRATRRGTKLFVGRTDDLLTVRGTIDKSSGPFETWITVPDPIAYFGGALRAALAQEGIAIDGGLRSVDQLPGPVWQLVAVHRSDLVTAIRTTNKRSQNFYAESLVKQVGARRCGHGSWADGVKVIGELMASIGILPGELRMVDGSGMSRENQASPRAITTLLRHMFYDPAGPELVKSLPFSGEDNKSWKRRLAAPPYLGNVFAKTGTLAGVSAISGYARGVSGKSYAFSILLNGTRGDPHGDQDRILRALIDHG
jgi:D-alanyl-D-alanine carboxypeptidase/D-alanyl-D-alanine-endopeptidase (penicillin-binding protein 4)